MRPGSGVCVIARLQQPSYSWGGAQSRDNPVGVARSDQRRDAIDGEVCFERLLRREVYDRRSRERRELLSSAGRT